MDDLFVLLGDISRMAREDMVWLQLLPLLKTYNQRHGIARLTLQSFLAH
jgi:hypothetical protein